MKKFMEFDNRLILVLVAAVGIYAVFLFMSDFNIMTEKISNFKIYFLPLILLLVTVSWIPLMIRWQFLLKTAEIHIPFKKSILVYLSGSALQITPGQIGELIKAQILKTSFGIPRTKTASVVLVEKIYDLIGAIIASIIGMIILELEIYLIIFAILILFLIFFFLDQKLEQEIATLKAQAEILIAPEPNSDTGEVPLRTGIAAALLDKKGPQPKIEKSNKKKLKMSLGKTKITIDPDVNLGQISGGTKVNTGNLH